MSTGRRIQTEIRYVLRFTFGDGRQHPIYLVQQALLGLSLPNFNDGRPGHGCSHRVYFFYYF
jgi:hypothetical protein